MPQKRKRRCNDDGALAELLHTGRVSMNGLSEILYKLRDSPALLDSSRRDISAANSEAFNQVATTIKLPSNDSDDTIDWTLAHPNWLLTKTVEQCPHFAQVLLETMQKHPPTKERPWGLIVGFDEFTPGDLMHGKQERKTMVLSYSFVELGRRYLSDVRFWLVPVCVRTSVISSVRGGWSCMLRKYLHLHLLGASGIYSVGCPMIIGGRETAWIGSLTQRS